jgi:hypothetical protein
VAQDVTALAYSDGTFTLHFSRAAGGAWVWADGEKFPLDGSYIDRVAATAEAMPVLQTIALTEEAPLSTYGLESTEVYLTYTNAAGTLTLRLGDQDESGNYYYSRSDDEANVYLTDATLRQQLSVPIRDMMVLPAIPVPAESQIQSVTIAGAGGTTELAVAQNEKNTVWTLSGADVTSRDEIAALRAELTAYSLSSCYDYGPSADAYGLCGLGAPRAVLSVTYLNSVNVPATYTLTIGDPRGDSYCATLGGDSTIYLIGGEKLGALLTLADNGMTA